MRGKSADLGGNDRDVVGLVRESDETSDVPKDLLGQLLGVERLVFVNRRDQAIAAVDCPVEIHGLRDTIGHHDQNVTDRQCHGVGLKALVWIDADSQSAGGEFRQPAVSQEKWGHMAGTAIRKRTGIRGKDAIHQCRKLAGQRVTAHMPVHGANKLNDTVTLIRVCPEC